MSSADKSPSLIVITAILISITVFSVALRTFTRLRLVGWLGADDVLILCAAVTAIPHAVGNIIGTVPRGSHEIKYLRLSNGLWTWQTYQGTTSGMARSIREINFCIFHVLFSISYFREIIFIGVLPSTQVQ